ncbi:hypothetical protein STEG23_024299 [Scotinomys teguina]
MANVFAACWLWVSHNMDWPPTLCEVPAVLEILILLPPFLKYWDTWSVYDCRKRTIKRKYVSKIRKKHHDFNDQFIKETLNYT